MICTISVALALTSLVASAPTLVHPGNPAITSMGRTWLSDSATM